MAQLANDVVQWQDKGNDQPPKEKQGQNHQRQNQNMILEKKQVTFEGVNKYKGLVLYLRMERVKNNVSFRIFTERVDD